MTLVAWYPLNGDTLDYSGNNFHATNNGAVVDNSGKIGKCYIFGDNRSVRTDILDLKGDISFALWMYPLGSSIESSFGGLISNHYHSSPPANFTMRYENNGRVAIHAGFIDGTRSAGIETSATVPMGKWSHIVFTYEVKTNMGRIYFDGVQVLERVFPKTVAFRPYNIIIGQWAHTYLDHYEFNGKINDVRIYDHVLSDKEIKEISKAKILHYTFDDFAEPTENLLNYSAHRFLSNNSNVYPIEDEVYNGHRRVRRNPDFITYPSTTLSCYTPVFYDYTAGSYTCSIEVKPEKDINLRISTSSPYTMCRAGTWTTLSHTYDYTTSGNARFPGIYGVVNADFNPWIEYRNAQVEKKDHATPFTPDVREGIVRDKSGYGNDAVLELSTTPQWVEDSKIGNGAYKFNGNSIITTKQLFTDNVNQCHTVSAWVYPTNPTYSSNQQLVNFNRGYRLYHTANGQSLMYMNSGTNDHYVYGSTIPANKWTMVTWVYDKANLICKVYYDGNLNASSSNFTSSDVPNGFSTSTIFGSNFVGFIDDIRIYATALSDEDIKELYQTRASVDNKGNFYSNAINETKHRPLTLDYTVWEDGQTGSVAPFTYYGNSSSNRRVLGSDPWGKRTVLWESFSTLSTHAGGILVSNLPIDNSKMYRFSVWERRVTNGQADYAYYYFGLNGYGSTNGVANAVTGTITTNPYFTSGSTNSAIVNDMLNDWVLVVGYVFPYDYTGEAHHPEAGRYNIKGEKLGTTTSFKWLPETTSARFRTYAIYRTGTGDSTGAIHHSVYPRIDICDGTEPTIAELLSGHDSRNIDYIRSNGGKGVQLDIQDNRTNLGEIYEVGMPIRYIRETMNGSSANAYNHWVEIQAYDKNGANVALGKSASSALLTDGNTASSPYYSGTSANVDLGEVMIVSYLKIWHYYADGRTYYDVKTEVSADGVNWITVFDSNIDGEYSETSSGNTILLRPQSFSIGMSGEIFTNELKEV
jgi:hypothetical protein